MELAMKYCPACGNLIKDEDEYCMYCGTIFNNAPQVHNNQNNMYDQNYVNNQNYTYDMYSQVNNQQNTSSNVKGKLVALIAIIAASVVMLVTISVVLYFVNIGGASDYQKAVKQYVYSCADGKKGQLAKIMVPSSGKRRKAKDAAEELIKKCDYNRESMEDIVITGKESISDDELRNLMDTFPDRIEIDFEMSNPTVLRVNVITEEVKETGKDGAVGFGELISIDHYTDFVAYQKGNKWFIIPMNEEYAGFTSLVITEEETESAEIASDQDDGNIDVVSEATEEEHSDQGDDFEQNEQPEEDLYSDESLVAFLTQFCKGYCIAAPEEYDCDNYPEGAYNILCNIASYNTPCADFSQYPVSQPDIVSDSSDSTIEAWFNGEGGVSYYKQDSVRWIATNIFNLSITDEEYNNLGIMAEDNHRFYREGAAEGDAWYITGAFEPGDGYVYNTYAEIENYERQGDRYIVTYNRMVNRDDPLYQAKYEAELEKKTIDGKQYWTMYRNHIIEKVD